MTKKREPQKPSDPDARLLGAAARLFRQKGFAASSLRKIAKAAGMFPGSVHYRYPTKESILLALMQQGIDQAIAAVRLAVAGCADPVERIRLGLRAHLQLLVSGKDAVYVLLYEWRALTGEAREEIVRLRDRYESFWAGMLYEAAGSGRLRDGVDLRLVRLFGFGAINWVAQWYRPGRDMTPEQIADAFFAFMAFGVMAEDRRPANLQSVFRSLHALELEH